MKHSLPLLIVLMLAAACKPTVPSQYIQPDDMEDMLYDYHLAEAMARSEYGEGVDKKRNIYFQSLLKKYDVSEADFDSSLVYYYSHLDRLREIYGHVNERLTEESDRVGAALGELNQYAQHTVSGDTANIWTGVTDLLLIPRPGNNRFQFTIKADSTFLAGDSFMFQFMTQCIWQSGPQNAIALLSARFANDSIVQNYSPVSSAGGTQVRINGIDDIPLKELRGFIYLPNDDASQNRRLMFISQLQLVRFHRHREVSPDSIAHEKSDSLKKDSIQRVTHSRGESADTTRRSAGGGLRSKNAPFRRRTGGN
jgi:hypothetical protein